MSDVVPGLSSRERRPIWGGLGHVGGTTGVSCERMLEPRNADIGFDLRRSKRAADENRTRVSAWEAHRGVLRDLRISRKSSSTLFTVPLEFAVGPFLPWCVARNGPESVRCTEPRAVLSHAS
jgi:hypothetical protein